MKEYGISEGIWCTEERVPAVILYFEVSVWSALKSVTPDQVNIKCYKCEVEEFNLQLTLLIFIIKGS